MMEIIIYLHLEYNKTTEIMEINFIFTFRLQQYHGDDRNQFIFTFRLQQYNGNGRNQFIFTLRLQQYHGDDRNQIYINISDTIIQRR